VFGEEPRGGVGGSRISWIIGAVKFSGSRRIFGKIGHCCFFKEMHDGEKAIIVIFVENNTQKRD